jgi:hypothetical protein
MNFAKLFDVIKDEAKVLNLAQFLQFLKIVVGKHYKVNK